MFHYARGSLHSSLVGSFLLSFAAISSAYAEPEALLPEKHLSFFESYCFDCHDSESQKGKVDLESLSFRMNTVEDAERWQKVLNVLNAGEMPPEKKAQPTNTEKADFLEGLSKTMVDARRILGDSGGKITMRRLNRREYRNTIRDLLGTEIDVRDLPADGGAGSFDTVGSSLFMSSDQFEQYLALGRKAMDEVFVRQSHTETWKQRREVEDHANTKVGGTYNGYYKKGYEVSKAYLDSDRSKPPSAFGEGIADEAEATFRVRQFEIHAPTFERYLNAPLTQEGAFLTISGVNKEEVIALPPEHPTGWLKTEHVTDALPPGEYVLRFRIGSIGGTEPERHFVDLGSRNDEVEFALMKTFQISGTTETPQTIEVTVSLSADGPRSFVLREKRDVNQDTSRFNIAQKATGLGPLPALWVDWVEWEGPENWENPAKLDFSTPRDGTPEAEWARPIIEQFALRAFRGTKPGSDYISRLIAIFENQRSTGESYSEALKTSLSVVLASPGFLYLYEPGEEGQPRSLTSLELATRLSYFLWSAPPDKVLLDLAHHGNLTDPEVLSQQTDRLLDDPKSREFVSGFVHQWLGMDRLDFFQFNTKRYPRFDESTKAAARQEVYESFEHLLKENFSLSNLLKSDYIVTNSLLATYYDIEGIAGDDFRRVALPEGSPRGGLLGMAAILAMGSNGEDTSPVERGAWVLRKLLHDPPPPAPPNVPQIARLEGQLLTTRERVLAHQEEAQCASCHRKIDPIGFGLENFDAVGKWRTKDSYTKNGVGKKEWDIDPSGAMHNGPEFADYQALRDIVASREEDFARGFTEALIEYALGRAFGFSDAELADSILLKARDGKSRSRTFIHSLVQSTAFQSK